jgi:hypothetical protein
VETTTSLNEVARQQQQPKIVAMKKEQPSPPKAVKTSFVCFVDCLYLHIVYIYTLFIFQVKMNLQSDHTSATAQQREAATLRLAQQLNREMEKKHMKINKKK